MSPRQEPRRLKSPCALLLASLKVERSRSRPATRRPNPLPPSILDRGSGGDRPGPDPYYFERCLRSPGTAVLTLMVLRIGYFDSADK
jgi:hypothetical protein